MLSERTTVVDQPRSLLKFLRNQDLSTCAEVDKASRLKRLARVLEPIEVLLKRNVAVVNGVFDTGERALSLQRNPDRSSRAAQVTDEVFSVLVAVGCWERGGT